MKPITVLALACVCSSACAQSSVTVFGTIDLNLTRSQAGDVTRSTMDQGGYLVPSRIGFRGAEDLGGGLAASFWLEAAVLPDTGASAAAFWGRRSTVSIASKQLGEIRLGRDYVPTFWNISAFTPFGTGGVGGASNIVYGWPNGFAPARTLARSSNLIGYHLPSSLGPIYGQFAVSAGEGVDGNKYRGGRIGYASGPANVAISYGRTAAAGSDFSLFSLGGSYDFKAVKVFVNHQRQRLKSEEQDNLVVGVSVPIGPHILRASVGRSDGDTVSTTVGYKANMVALGYVYQFSKRTLFYSAVSRIDNKGRAAFVVADGSPAGVPGRASSGTQLGVVHSF